jgi:leucyl aminopeptidase
MITIKIKSGSPAKQRDDAIVLPLFAGRRLSASGETLRKGGGKSLAAYLRKFDQLGEFGEMGILYHIEGILSSRLVLLGAGEERSLDLQKLRRLAAIAARRLDQTGARDISMYLAELGVRGASLADKVQAIAEGVWLGLYRFSKYQTKKEENKRALRSVTLMIPSRRQLDEAQEAVRMARACCEGVLFARDLANEPGNVCTPSYLGEQAESLKADRLSVTVLDKKAIEEAGFRGLLAVNQGSGEEPRFIILNYRGGGKEDAPIAIVGKGLTFDSGGISIKPPQHMDEMKFDMCGAAAVLGVFKAVTSMALPLNLMGVIASTENLPGSSAYKPGDIIRSYKGITIEVLNTDAEGRIILADALAYAAEQKPAAIIDLATLTGACVIALGAHASGLMGNNEDLLVELEKSASQTHDRVWRLPLFSEYQEQIKSNIADIKNIGGREAGAITAACFLSRFVDDLPWAHLDIAGTAWNMKGDDINAKGATGAGVRLLLNFLSQRAS